MARPRRTSSALPRALINTSSFSNAPLGTAFGAPFAWALNQRKRSVHFSSPMSSISASSEPSSGLGTGSERVPVGNPADGVTTFSML